MTIPVKFQGRSFKSVTFSDTAGGSYAMFTLTGTVIVNVVAVCTAELTSAAAANVSLGIGAGAELIPVTVATTIDTGEVWVAAAPARKAELSSTVRESIISNGNDINLTLTGQVDLGTLEFYCFWSALSADGLVVPA